MISLEVYKWLHVLGLLLLFGGLIGLWAARFSGATLSRALNVKFALVHGFGMALMLVSGFGMLARLGIIQGWPTWVWVKFTIWLLLGGAIALAKRKAQWGFPLALTFIALGALAAYFGILKPIP